MASQLDPNDTSILPPPLGVTSNFIDPPIVGPAVAAGLVVLIALATLSFAARAFTKAYVMRKLQVDDCRYHLHSSSSNELTHPDLLSLGWVS